MLHRRPLTGACAMGLWLALTGPCVPASVTTAPPPSVALSITYTAGSSVHAGATLTCRSGLARATGFLVHRSTALLCRRARVMRLFLASAPARGRLCSQIYGGPDRALIRGTIGTDSIRRRFGRADGCQIADWTRARLLLPPPSGAQ
ncbi:MAG: hypothetical protein ACJ76S_05900 [Solirubrobacteraceae bacterium]|jgi:hypothetical protein